MNDSDERSRPGDEITWKSRGLTPQHRVHEGLEYEVMYAVLLEKRDEPLRGRPAGEWQLRFDSAVSSIRSSASRGQRCAAVDSPAKKA